MNVVDDRPTRLFFIRYCITSDPLYSFNDFLLLLNALNTTLSPFEKPVLTESMSQCIV